MCGLAGVMGRKLDLNTIQKFKDIFLFSQIRGEDGAGMMSVPTKEVIQSVRVQRTTWSSGHLVTTKEFSDCIKGDVSIIVGHARQPTRGGTKIENVHPHRHKDILLVHNGTMTYINDASVPINESDSKLVCKTIAEHGPQGFVDKSYGAYCLVWINLADQTLNFLRNSERPLWFCEEKHSILANDGIKNIYWASEQWMLNTGLGRYASYLKDKHIYYSLPVDEHWSFPLNVSKEIAEPKITPCKRAPYSVVPYYGSGFSHETEIWHTEDQDIPFKKGGAGGTTNPSSGFQYTPPEHRQRTKPIHQTSAILLKSKQDAMLNEAARKKGADSQSAVIFPAPTSKDLDQYVCKDHKRVRDMVAHAPCVWCSLKPVWKSVDGKVTEPPRIFPVRYTQTRDEYVCGTCIEDLDVQRMVGVA